MKKRLIALAVVIIAIIGGIIGYQQYKLYQTKQYSPSEIATFSNNQVSIEIAYSRPYKNDREIFGKLVPYGKWWRTGANEATTVRLSRDITFSTDTLKAGYYSIVTYPEPDEWTIVFNNKIPDWGTSYFPEEDELKVKAKVEQLPDVVEQFTIDFSEENGLPVLIMAWDRTKVSTPFRVL